ncbi:MAG: SH3 domain-containing protein [Acidobacteria bacterium]|nr:SH3 domain-containing protein [Acidobacteriota bacterium]
MPKAGTAAVAEARSPQKTATGPSLFSLFCFALLLVAALAIFKARQDRSAMVERPLVGARVTDAVDLNLRAGPGTSAARVAIIPRGSTVEVLTEEAQVATTQGPSVWIQIRYQGTVGWVNKKFLAVAP